LARPFDKPQFGSPPDVARASRGIA